MTGDLRFYDNDRPPVVAGDYELTVTQRVRLPAPDPSPDDYVAVQPLQVSGPHFGLGADDVVTVYPAPGSAADQHASLAHVVLARPTLPWEIALDPDAVPPGAEADPAEPDPLVPPWLAVLVLTPEEVVYPDDAVATGNLTGTRVVALPDYLRPAEGVVGPSFTPEQASRYEAEYPDLRCTVVEVVADAFDALAPSSDELTLLAHTREVDTVDQETDGATGWFGVVVGNRFPAADRASLYVAHLVSLEGFAGHLPDRRDGPTTGTVRLLSLYAWTFRSFAAGDGFDALAQHLDVDVLRLPAPPVPDPGTTMPRDDPTSAEALVQKALDEGYTAAPYVTRLGERTTAWYRGPLLPVEMERNRQPSYAAAEAALLYDPTTGLFDVSFAAAWQTGRLLALADRDFAVALLAWLRGIRSAAGVVADRLELFRRLDVLDQPGSWDALVAPGAGRRALVDVLARVVAPSVTGLGGASGAGAPTGARDLVGAGGGTLPRVDPSGVRGVLHRFPGVVAWHELEALADATVPGRAVAVPRPGGAEGVVADLARSRPGAAASPRPSIPEQGRAGRDGAPTGWAARGRDPLERAPARPRAARERAVLGAPSAVAPLIDVNPVPDAVSRWLGRLSILEGVPFEHLVPDARMLPAESVRFFHVDPNWLDALVDGALSIGAVAEPEAATLEVVRDHVRDAARLQAVRERGRRRATRAAASARSGLAASAGVSPGASTAVAAPPDAALKDETPPAGVGWTGFVLRSAIVTDWPGLRVSATPLLDGEPVPSLLRLDRPAPSVLVAVFDAPVGQVWLATPAQTLHFGAVDESGELMVLPRGLGGRFDVGGQLQVAAVQVPRRPQAPGSDRVVVDVGELSTRLTERLVQAYAPDPAPPLDPGAFAVQLVAAAELQRFVRPAGAPPPRAPRRPSHVPPPQGARPAGPDAGTPADVLPADVLPADVLATLVRELHRGT